MEKKKVSSMLLSTKVYTSLEKDCTDLTGGSLKTSLAFSFGRLEHLNLFTDNGPFWKWYHKSIGFPGKVFQW